MKQKLNIEAWARKDQFNFFSKFEEPFFGVTVRVDCTHAYRLCKTEGTSFFIYYLYQALKAANEVEPFRYRISGKDVFHYDVIHASPTINRHDGTFGFGYMDHADTLAAFTKIAQREIEKVRSTTGLIPAVSGENVIHFSSIPWLDFTSLSHARSFSFPDSCPKISFGKMTVEKDKRTMPVSIHVHHALMDGYHVGVFVDRFQQLLNGND